LRNFEGSTVKWKVRKQNRTLGELAPTTSQRPILDPLPHYGTNTHELEEVVSVFLLACESLNPNLSLYCQLNSIVFLHW